MKEQVKYTVNLHPKALQALVDAAERTGHTRTDTVNRALHIYNEITAALASDKLMRLSITDTFGVVGSLLVYAPNLDAEIARFMEREVS